MLLTVRDACEPHPMALDYAMGDQIESLSEVIEATAQDADDFFAKNFVTKGMETLLNQGLKRLAGRSGQAVFELKQAMGGGKTHSMIALGLLARDPALQASVVPELARDAPFELAKVVAVNGRVVSREVFIWGDIARQLGKEEAFARFWKHGAEAPGEREWLALIGDEPTLVLLDELPPYFDYAITRAVGGGTLAQVATYALSNLLSASLKLKRCCIVISNLSGSYEGASRDLSKAIRNFREETNRQARAVTPVELASQEIYDILRKRLLRRLPDATVIDSVATAYASAFSEAVRSKSIARSAEQITDEVHGAYPFHPSVKHVVALFKENESYRQTRGLMQFVSKIIKSVWDRPANDVYLMGCQHLNISQYYDTAHWVAASLTDRLPEERVALYAGAGKSGLFFAGEWRSLEREDIKRAVRDRTIRLVVATDAACEGLDLQTLGTLINVDLPWNPSRLEQRIGRIKRFGQTRDRVDMLNLVYHETHDEKVYEVLSRRMKDRYDLFGSLPDTIDDDWIEDIENLDEHKGSSPSGSAARTLSISATLPR